MTDNYSGGDINLSLEGLGSSVLRIGKDGNCVVSLGEAIVSSEGIASVVPESQKEAVSSPERSTNVDGISTLNKTVSGQISFPTTLSPDFIAADATGLRFVFGETVFETVVEFAPTATAIGKAPKAGGDFSQYLTEVNIVDQSSLPNPLPRDATVKLAFTYKLTADLIADSATQYAFTLPKAITSQYQATNGSDTIAIKDGDVEVATVTIGGDGNCFIVFKVQDIAAAGTVGEFHLSTKLDAKEIPNGTNKLVIKGGSPDGEFEISVNFKLDPIEGALKIDPNAGTVDLPSKLIMWETTVTPELTNAEAIPNTGNPKELTNFVINTAIDDKLTVIFDQSDPALTNSPTITDGTTPIPGAVFTTKIDGSKTTLVCTLPVGEWSGKNLVLNYHTSYGLDLFEKQDGTEVKNITTASFEHPQYKGTSSNNIELDSSKKGTVKATEKNAIALIEMFLLKKDSLHITADQTINWTVTVNESQINFGSAGSSYDVTDKIPEGLKLTSVSLDDTPFTGYTYSGGARLQRRHPCCSCVGRCKT